MVATLACAPVTFTASAPRARGRVPASRSRAARSGAPARSIEARATAEATFPEPSVAFAARETRCRVYIEHTDAYQVVYHANYFKFLARGREEALFGARGGEIVAALTSEGSEVGGTSSDGDATPFLVAAPATRARAARFASPATLGDDLIVTSAVIEVDAREKTVVFEQTVVDAATRETRFAATTAVVALFSSFADGDDGDDGETFEPDHPTWLALNAAEKRSDEPTRVENAGSDEPSTRGGRSAFVTKITLHREELGRGEFGFCEADVLRFFERNRTDAIGGSAALARLKDERGIIVVVSGMEDIAFAPGGMRALVAREKTKKAPPRLRTVFSRCETSVKRRGLQIAFAHELVALAPTEGPDLDAWSSQAVVLARAEVTCTCLSAETGRPVRCPEELAARFAT